MRKRATSLLGLAACVMILSSCSLAGPPELPYRDVRPPLTAAEAASPQCPRDGVGLGAGGADTGAVSVAGTLPATFKAEFVRSCRRGDVEKADTGLRYTVSEQTSPIDERLLTSLALPDHEFDPGDNAAACAANYTPPVYLLLIDAKNRAYRPHLPADPCETPRAEVQAAIDVLPPTKVTTYTFDKVVQ